MPIPGLTAAAVQLPQWFGAVGDGVTDDTAAFNAALAAGDYVWVPQGAYAIAGTISVRNKVLEGATPKTQLNRIGASTDPIVQITGGDQTVVRNFRLANTITNSPNGVFRVAADIGTNLWPMTQNIRIIGNSDPTTIGMNCEQGVSGLQNYFGTFNNTEVRRCGVGVYSGSESHAHTWLGLQLYNIVTYGVHFDDTVEHTVVGGFCHQFTAGAVQYQMNNARYCTFLHGGEAGVSVRHSFQDASCGRNLIMGYVNTGIGPISNPSSSMLYGNQLNLGDCQFQWDPDTSQPVIVIAGIKYPIQLGAPIQ